jgi:hypothetical protein
MSVFFPLVVNFTVVSVSTTDEVFAKEGHLSGTRRLACVLRADSSTEIVLSSGEKLSAVETHISLTGGIASAGELARELSNEEVGYLIHSARSGEPPFVHGAMLWPGVELPHYLLSAGLESTVQLTLSSLPMPGAHEPPHSWVPGRGNLIRVGSFTLSCVRKSRGRGSSEQDG